MGIKPVTPGTIVVAAGTILLILATVSVPLVKSFYFLEAEVDGVNFKLGTWGFCAGDVCSNSTLGYSLDVDALFGTSGSAASSSIPETLIKWMTYVLILHPIAAGFGLIATLLGVLSHIREFSMAGFTTCFAGFGGVIGLIAFAFDIAMFTVAKNRISGSDVGGTATLGNAIWMTLVGGLCLLFSGCFFGLGRCLIRKRKHGRETSEKNKPVPDANYGQSMRQDALGNGGYGQGAMYGQNGGQNTGYVPSSSAYGAGKKEGGLPVFQDRNGEIVPLNSGVHSDDEESVYPDGRNGRANGDNASLVSGVGMGYGKRTQAGMPVSLSDASGWGGAGVGAGAAAGAGAGYLATNGGRQNSMHNSTSGSTTAPFVGMHHAPAPSPSLNDPYPNYQNYAASTPTPSLTPSGQMPQPTIAGQPATGYYRGGGTPSAGEYGYSNPSSRGGVVAPTPIAPSYPNDKVAGYYASPPAPSAYGTTSVPPSQYSGPASQYVTPSQSYRVQNPSPSPPPTQYSHAPTYQTAPQSTAYPYEHSSSTFGGARDSVSTYGDAPQQRREETTIDYLAGAGSGLQNPYEGSGQHNPYEQGAYPQPTHRNY